MIRKIFCLFFALCLVSVANAQEPFILELREAGNYYFGNEVLEGYLLTVLNKTKFKVAPSCGYATQDKPRIRVNASINNQDASVSGSSNFFNTSSYSTSTRIYSTLSITATLTSGSWCESVTTVVSDSISFTEYAQSNYNFKNYNFSIPTANSREQKRLELNNRLLTIALGDLAQKINALSLPVATEPVVDCSMPIRRMKIRLSQEFAQKYANLGYVAIVRNGQEVRYKVVESSGSVLTVEFSGEPIRATDTLK